MFRTVFSKDIDHIVFNYLDYKDLLHVFFNTLMFPEYRELEAIILTCLKEKAREDESIKLDEDVEKLFRSHKDEDVITEKDEKEKAAVLTAIQEYKKYNKEFCNFMNPNWIRLESDLPMYHRLDEKECAKLLDTNKEIWESFINKDQPINNDSTPYCSRTFDLAIDVAWRYRIISLHKIIFEVANKNKKIINTYRRSGIIHTMFGIKTRDFSGPLNAKEFLISMIDDARQTYKEQKEDDKILLGWGAFIFRYKELDAIAILIKIMQTRNTLSQEHTNGEHIDKRTTSEKFFSKITSSRHVVVLDKIISSFLDKYPNFNALKEKERLHNKSCLVWHRGFLQIDLEDRNHDDIWLVDRVKNFLGRVVRESLR